MNNQLQAMCRRLRLSGLAGTLDVRLQEASGNRLSHDEFLELVFQDEIAVRDQRLLARRTKAASFRDVRTLDDFDFSFNTSIRKKQIFELATCKFVPDARDLPSCPKTASTVLGRAI